MTKTSKGQQVLWRPNKGPQTRFLASSVRELLYGGEAGGGKTDGLVMAPLRWVHLPKFHACLFRRTYPELESSLIERSKYYYPQLGARYNETKHQWRFPRGARVAFRALQHEKDVFAHQSDEFHFIGFDELTHFTDRQYRYLLSRLRGPEGYPLRIRAGTNPEPNWVKNRWAPWVNRSQEYLDSGAPVAGDGEILWVLPTADGGEEYVPAGTPKAFSRCFIRSGRRDTPQLSGDYETQLLMQDAVQRARLMDGDWDAVPAAGLYYKRDWCETVSASDVPADAQLIRHWDRAGTEEGTGGDPDWTVGVKMARKGSTYWIVDVQRFRKSPGGVDSKMLKTAESDGRACTIGIFQDPGQAGKDQAQRLVRMLAGYRVKTLRETGSIIVRFGGLSSQAEHGNVKIVRGAWNAAFHYELEAFPDGSHDDQAAASAGAFRNLLGTVSGFGSVGQSRAGARVA